MIASEGRKIDLRVSTFPTNKGREDRHPGARHAGPFRSTSKTSVSPRTYWARSRRTFGSPNGIILVTGPTGSGKSTTLYAALNSISSMENNVCTVEDPIEYHLPLLNQFQVQDPRSA